MTRQSTAEQPKTSNLSHQPLSVCAKRKLTGFAEFAQICGTTPTRNRDANGNRTSKTTPWGTVKYAYDKENRMTESGDLGKSESVKYTYDANGNLLSEVAARYRKDYVYNAQNRMIFSDVQDAFLNTRNLTEYAYDAFGRRIETIEYLGDHTRNLYDGFSFDIAEKTVLQTHAAATMPEQKYRAGGAGANSSHPEPGSGSASTGRSGAGVANGTRYRYIGDENLVPLENAGGNTGAQASSSANGAAKTRSRPNAEYVLYAYGEPVAMSADGDTSYFGTDILGSVRSVTDKYGNVKAQYEYDAFGTPYLANLENDVGFGYCGKVYDSATGLYDYGFRDYSPNSARFITVDPVRDGNNWFSYVVNDPVNYIDPFGLEVTLKDEIKDFLSQFSGEITNQTEGYLFPRAEDNAMTQYLFDNDFRIEKGETLTEALAKIGKDSISIDGIVLPDGTIYKGWSGSKITVTQKADGSYRVSQSFGTFIINSLSNVLIWFENLGVSKEEKKDYYKYYNTVKELNALENKINDNVSNWYNLLPQNYLNQNTGTSNKNNTGSALNNGSNISFGTSGIYGDVSIIPNYSTLNSNNFGIKDAFMNGSVIQNFIKPSVSANLANFAINSVTSGITMGGCTK